MGRRKQIINDILQDGKLRIKEQGQVLKVEKKRGVGAERFKNDDLFKNSRQKSKEFKNCVDTGRFMCALLAPLLKDVNDAGLQQNLFQYLSAINKAEEKKTDNKAGFFALEPVQMKTAFYGYDFNSQMALKQCFKNPESMVMEKAGLRLRDFRSAEDLLAPEDCVKVQLTLAVLCIDWQGRRGDLHCGDAQVIWHNRVRRNVFLELPACHCGKGIPLVLLQIRFLNQLGYNAANGRATVLHVMREVGE